MSTVELTSAGHVDRDELLRDDGTGTLRREPTGLEREYAKLAAAEHEPDDLDGEVVA